MNTTLDQNAAVYRLLNVPAVKSVISGGVYNGKNPTNSKLEDITVNSITLGRGTRQFGMVNVNIHVDDVSMKAPDGTNYTQINTGRFKAITDVVVGILKETDGENYALWVAGISNPLPISGFDRHFINIRVETRFYDH